MSRQQTLAHLGTAFLSAVAHLTFLVFLNVRATTPSLKVPERESADISAGTALRGGAAGMGNSAAKESSPSAILLLRDLDQRPLFHFHVIKIETYNSWLRKHGRQSAGKSFILPCGRVTARRQALGKHL